jgi:hypothetical protein
MWRPGDLPGLFLSSDSILAGGIKLMGTFRLQAKLLVRLGLFDFPQAWGVDNAK